MGLVARDDRGDTATSKCPILFAMKLFLGIQLLLSLVFCVGHAAEPGGEPVTGVIAAMPAEMRILEQRLKHKQTQTFLGTTFHSGIIEGRKVVLATSGIGKVNAAKTAALLLDHFMPDEVIFSGVAGGTNPDLAPGDIVLGVRTAQHDFGRMTAEGFEPQPPDADTPLFIEAPAKLVDLAHEASERVVFDPIQTSQGRHLPRVIRGVIVTGDVFVASPRKSSELRQLFKADAVEMEGAAVAMICWQQRVPCVVVRCVSDKADSAAWDDFERFLANASNNSAKLTVDMLKLLAERRTKATGHSAASKTRRLQRR